ncbi:MAG: 30S ribosomal protein S20 [Christensenellaceae bacterium]|jgi:small subunit ribosomal protein S20|nr:30S ribosomal protein S20 [Christensenellaceae bacterium]
MANIKSSIKRIKTNRAKHSRNKPIKSALSTEIKKFRANPTEAELKVVFSKLDSAAGGHIIHQNKANRLKAALSNKIKVSQTEKKDIKTKETEKKEIKTKDIKTKAAK